MTEGISHEEWIAELERLQSSAPLGDGLTCKELQALWGCSERIAQTRLRRLSDQGRLEYCRKWVSRIDGLKTPVSSYKLKPPAEGKEVP